MRQPTNTIKFHPTTGEDLPEDTQTVLWYYRGIGEPPYVGSANDSDFPGLHKFWAWCECPNPDPRFEAVYNGRDALTWGQRFEQSVFVKI